MTKDSKIFIAGHQGLVGSALTKALEKEGYTNLVSRTRGELDLLNQEQVNRFFQQEKIDFVFVAAARVGGILANQTFPTDFLYENLMIACNVLHAAAETNVKKLLYLGSSCIYPRLAPQPMSESELLNGPLEKTNEGYALAKIAGLKLCEYYNRQYNKNFISAMPTNLYGPNDNFHPDHSHVIPGLFRKFHEAKKKNAASVKIWGTGKVLREFLHVDDLASALIFLMKEYNSPETVNIGSQQEVSILELANLISDVVCFKGEIEFDSTKPDGTPRKLLDCNKINQMGWTSTIPLKQGLFETYQWIQDHRTLD